MIRHLCELSQLMSSAVLKKSYSYFPDLPSFPRFREVKCTAWGHTGQEHSSQALAPRLWNSRGASVSFTVPLGQWSSLGGVHAGSWPCETIVGVGRQMPSPRIVSAPSPRGVPSWEPWLVSLCSEQPGGSSTPPRCEYTQPSGSQESLAPESSGGPAGLVASPAPSREVRGWDSSACSDWREGTQAAERRPPWLRGSVLHARELTWALKCSWQVGKTMEGLVSSRGMMSDPKVLFSHAILKLHSWKRSPRRICFHLNSFDVAFFPVFLSLLLPWLFWGTYCVLCSGRTRQTQSPTPCWV